MDVLARLTGVRTSKLSFYKQYRRTSESLDRSILALASVSKALTAVDAGPASLVESFLPAVVETMGAQWAALVAEYSAFPEQPYARMATREGLLALPDLPAEVLALLQEPPPAGSHSPADCHDVAGHCVPLRWDSGWGWLAVGLPDSRTDDTDAALMTTLAHQVVAAVQASYLLVERERLRAVASAAYEDASAHAQRLARTNRALRQARSALARAR